MKKGRECYFILIYILYILLLFPFIILTSFISIFFSCPHVQRRRRAARKEGGKDGGRGRLDVVKENGCWERMRLWLEVVVEVVVGSG